MADAAFYREAAKRHRELAAATSIPEQAAQFLRFAREYETLAAMVSSEGEVDPPPPATGPVQHQPQQQQQTKAEDEDGSSSQ